MFKGGSKDTRFEQELIKLAPNNNVRFITAAPNGELLLSNKSVRRFTDDINARDGELIADYKHRDGIEAQNAISRMDARDANVTKAFKNDDVSYFNASKTDAQTRANVALARANANTSNNYLRKNTNYKMYADNHRMGRSPHEHWGHKSLSWNKNGNSNFKFV
tara:strand:+ start:2576 stop:3064 length:489 start_codon:yes stop_codon:yes gene_type:complete